MWTRAELKERAKACLRKYYWAAFAVSLVFSLVSGIGSPVTQPADSGYQDDYYEEYGFVEGLGDDLPAVVGKIPAVIENVPVGPGVVQTGRMIYGVMAGVMIVFLILALVLGIFVIPVIAVGHNRYYMESRLMGRSAGFGKLLWGFSRHYLNIVLTMFLRDLIIVGGTFLCVLPGLYFAYCYYMVPYILAENPEMKPMEALRLSKQMMEGHKMNTWLLEMSFFGWMFLGAMACGVGKTPEERYEHAAEFVRMVGLEDYADLTPVELSTGMKQRLGLARVLAGQAQLLLMDEPFAALDFLTRAELQTQLLTIQQRLPRTIVLVTHQLEEALLLGQKIVVMHPDSTICEFDLTDLPYPRDPDSPRLRQLKEQITAQCRMATAN